MTVIPAIIFYVAIAITIIAVIAIVKSKTDTPAVPERRTYSAAYHSPVSRSSPPQRTTYTSRNTNSPANRRQTTTVPPNTGRPSTPPIVTEETEIMDYFANTRHNQKDNWFRFKYKHVENEWRAYIIRMPSLNGRDGDLHITHRYSDPEGNYWVCRDPMPDNLKDMQTISKFWADCYLEYVATGVEANDQVWD